MQGYNFTKMKTSIRDLIKIDTSITTPVYKQIVQSIYKNIENGILKKEDRLPSVNNISETFSLARGSVFNAYNDLRSSGIIQSIPGKGYFISSTAIKQSKRIFLLFSTFTSYKETIFNSLLNKLPSTCTMDIYFHHHSIKMFENLINEQAGYYNTFIVMPEVNENTLNILSKLDRRHTFLLDVGFKEYRKSFSGVYQNFEKDIFSILVKSENLVSKYKRLFLVFPEGLRSKDIITGFNKFSKKSTISTASIQQINPNNVEKGDAFIVIDDKDLVDVIKLSRERKWQLGKDIGIISYNESSLKSVIGEGVTTISTDFVAMGETMADMIMNGKRNVIENPFILIDRQSF